MTANVIYKTRATVIRTEWAGEAKIETVVEVYTKAADGPRFYDTAIRRCQQLNSFGRDVVMSGVLYRVFSE